MMFMNKRNYLFLCILITNCYFVCALSDNRQTRGSIRYQYNHPPEFEYQPIPVAIVYEEKNDRASKKIDTTSSTEKTTTTTTTLKPVEIEINTTTTSTTAKNDIEDIKVSTSRPVTTISQNEARALKPTKIRIYPEKEIHIPVEVIYDTESDIIVKKKKNEDTSSLRRAEKQRLQKEYKDISINRRTAKKISETTTTPTTFAPQTAKISIPEVNRPSPTSTTTIAPKQPVNEVATDRMKGKRREKDPVVPIVESENHVYAQNGAFQYSYEGGDGTKAFEKGELKEFDDESTGESVSGGFSYTDKDGQKIRLTYTADENGYRPVGDHLPTPPPIPAAIARALRYLATKPTDPPEDNDVTEPSNKE